MAIEKPLRLFYAAGPGDIIGTYRYWKQKQEDPSYLGVTDSGQFYDLTVELGAKALAISSCPRKEMIEEDPFILKHIPKSGGSGLAFHVNHLSYGLRLCYEAICFKADVAVVEEGTSHWFVWNLLHFFGIKVIPSIKCLFWPQFKPISFQQKVFNYANRSFFRKKVLAILSMSPAIEEQVEIITGGKHPSILNFLPIYKREVFDNIAPPIASKRPFNVLYIGRIESYKGVFDLAAIAKKFKEMNINDIHFHFCGDGSAMEELKKKMAEGVISETCHLHGQCNRDQLKKWLGESHVVIAPSRTFFIEGFCMVVVEGVLAGRPVITSKVCPAMYSVPQAVCEAKPDDVDSYAEAILSLYRSTDLYLEKQKACSATGQPFYERDNSWQAALKRAIK